MIGQTVSHYRVIEKLGEGGMGVVYRAEDTKLKRTVALKFLPKHLEEHRERFLREAQAAAALNHPNICTIFEVDEEHGFLVMELVEGKTVKEKIAERPLPLAEAIDLATQVCAGLQHAHERGIVHRDIKPANLMVTAAGAVKIMDFGLAQVGDRTRITKTGASIGTPAYMSPEQVKGEAVDRRTDIWSLGVVVYEALTQRIPFAAETEQAVSYAIVHAPHEPVTAVRGGLPVSLDGVVAKCLAKQADERYQHVEDFAVDVRTLGKAGASAPPRRRLGWLPALAVGSALLIGATATFVYFKRQRTESPKAVRRYEMVVDGGLLGISPDGETIAFRKGSVGYLRRLDSIDPVEIPGSDGISALTWSPNGAKIAFAKGNMVWKYVPQQSAPEQIAKLRAAVLSLVWPAEFGIVAAVYGSGLLQIPESGGATNMLLAPDGGQSKFDFHEPIAVPGGVWLVVTHGDVSGGWRAVAIQGNTTNVLFESPARIVLNGFVSGRYLLYNYQDRSAGLWALEIDPVKWKAIGTARRVEDDCVNAAVAANGDLVCTKAYVQANRLLVTDRMGRTAAASKEEFPGLMWPAVSPDGKSAVAEFLDDWNADILKFDLATMAGIKAAHSSGQERRPGFHPAGDRIVYNKNAWYTSKRTDGSTTEQQLAAAGRNARGSWAWAPNGKLAIFQRMEDDGERLWVFDASAPATPAPFPAGTKASGAPTISPDGKYVAYGSTESGRSEVYVSTFPDGKEKWIVSQNGGGMPRWSSGGDELFWLSTNNLNVTRVSRNPSFQMLKTEVLFQNDQADASIRLRLGYDVTPDGKRIVTIGAGKARPSRVVMVENWIESVGLSK